MAVSNGLNYAFNLVMVRLLEPGAYGALGALLAVVLIGTVPGLAVQAVVARHTAVRGGDRARRLPAPRLAGTGAVAGGEHPAAAAGLGPPGDAARSAALRGAGRGAAGQRGRTPGGGGRPGRRGPRCRRRAGRVGGGVGRGRAGPPGGGPPRPRPGARFGLGPASRPRPGVGAG